MKFVQVSRNPEGQGVKQFIFSLPNSVRLLYAQDPVRCEDWKALIMDFDAKLPNCNETVLNVDFIRSEYGSTC